MTLEQRGSRPEILNDASKRSTLGCQAHTEARGAACISTPNSSRGRSHIGNGAPGPSIGSSPRSSKALTENATDINARG
mgnify:CR=1 FL=1